MPRPRDLRDSGLGRLVIIAVVLLVALLASRSCTGRGDAELSRTEAIEVAEREAAFKRDGAQVRYVQQGIPPRGVWIVSFYAGAPNDPTRVQTILVDASTGLIIEQ